MDDYSALEDLQNLEILENLEQRERFICRDRTCDLDVLDNFDFQLRYRLNKDIVEDLIRTLDDELSSQTAKNYALSSAEKICIGLRYFATGNFQLTIGDLANVSQSSASRAIKEVAEAIASLRPNYIRLPETDNERRQISQDYYLKAGFPGVFGALDCTHIKIISPGGERAEDYRNRHGDFTLNVQTVSDASLMIRDIVACWPGSTHDSTIFDNSRLRAIMETQIPAEYHLLGDNGYGCRSYLLTPFLNPSTAQQQRYNRAHIKARNSVERQYGAWKRRFPCLRQTMQCKLNTSMTIIVATAVLHNIALQMHDDCMIDPVEDDNAGNNSQSNDSQRIIHHIAGVAKRNAMLSTVFH